MTSYTGDKLRIGAAKFIDESFYIEGLKLDDKQRVEQTDYLLQFLDAPLNVDIVYWYVRKVTSQETKRMLRDLYGRDVMVGNYFPPKGGSNIPILLEDILHVIRTNLVNPFVGHVRYENLHPFMDGNGRSGRAIWAWHMYKYYNYKFDISFLHKFYYQTLDVRYE